jgi:hypothetical protein
MYFVKNITPADIFIKPRNDSIQFSNIDREMPSLVSLTIMNTSNIPVLGVLAMYVLGRKHQKRNFSSDCLELSDCTNPQNEKHVSVWKVGSNTGIYSDFG